MRPIPKKDTSARNAHLYLVALENWSKEAEKEILHLEKELNKARLGIDDAYKNGFQDGAHRDFTIR